MTRLFMLLAVLLAFSQAEARDSARPPGQEAPGEQVSEINPTPDMGPVPAWPVPFQPSQEIGADSPVSFPTDI
jgi:hypothetical protein